MITLSLSAVERISLESSFPSARNSSANLFLSERILSYTELLSSGGKSILLTLKSIISIPRSDTEFPKFSRMSLINWSLSPETNSVTVLRPN